MQLTVKVPEKPCQGGKGHGHMKAGKRKVFRFAFLNLLTEDRTHHEFKLFHTNVVTLTQPFSSPGRLWWHVDGGPISVLALRYSCQYILRFPGKSFLSFAKSFSCMACMKCHCHFSNSAHLHFDHSKHGLALQTKNSKPKANPGSWKLPVGTVGTVYQKSQYAAVHAGYMLPTDCFWGTTMLSRNLDLPLNTWKQIDGACGNLTSGAQDERRESWRQKLWWFLQRRWVSYIFSSNGEEKDNSLQMFLSGY